MKIHQTRPILGGILMAALFLTSSFAAEPVASDATTMPEEASLGAPYASVDIPDALDEVAAMNACIHAATGREWRIVGKEGNWLRINLKHRGWDATVYFVIKDGSVVIYSDSYEVNKKTGEHKKKAEPKGWLKNLSKDVAAFMDRAAYIE